MPKPISPPTALMNLAITGHAKAQFDLAELYMQSEHEDDNILAEQWALKSAENGYVEAMYWLGEGYTVYAKEVQEENSEEAKTYFELAYYWLNQASLQKHASATLELAGYYRRGDVVEKDITKSIHYVTQAAELGDIQAMRDLACIYEHGLGIDIDEEKADFWSLKAKQFS